MARQKTVSKLRLWTVRILKIGVVLGLAGFFALAVAVVIAMQSLPSFDSLKSSPNGQMIRVHADDGTVIVSLGPSYGAGSPTARFPSRWSMRSSRPRTSASTCIPASIRSAWRAAPGALMCAAAPAGASEGGSTITQQLARNIFLNNSYTAGRKLREIILALALERKFTKRQVLELYLNKVYFGGGAYGVDAASRKFFNHPASDLTLAESAVIAGLVKAPSHYSPTADVEGRARPRRRGAAAHGRQWRDHARRAGGRRS